MSRNEPGCTQMQPHTLILEKNVTITVTKKKIIYSNVNHEVIQLYIDEKSL